MTTFKVPKQTAKSIQTVTEFLGADFTNSPANIDIRRSPNCKNMIRDVPGKVRKSMGWEVMRKYSGGAINGVHYFSGDKSPENEEPIIGNEVTVFEEGKTVAIMSRNHKITRDEFTEYVSSVMTRAAELYRTNTNNTFPSVESSVSAVVAQCFLESYTDKPINVSVSIRKASAVSRFQLMVSVDWITNANTELTITSVTESHNSLENISIAYCTPAVESYRSEIYFYWNNETWDASYLNTYSSQPMTMLGYSEIKSSSTYGTTTVDKSTDTSIKEYTNPKSVLGYAVHVGDKLYFNGDVIYSGMNNARSKSWQFDDKLYIVDGKCLLVYQQKKNEDGTITHVVKPASQDSYIPTLTISKDPSGGGTPYEALNLLQPGFTEMFLGKASVTEYALSFKDLDDTEVKVEVMKSDGSWQAKKENTDFTVNRVTGVVTFKSAPGVSPSTGEDNVKITAFKTVAEYADRINHCTIGTLYGVGGSPDRLFLSGNEKYPNYDWFSEQFNPQYFADTNYSRLGSDRGSIIGYSVVNNYLATHKDEKENSQNIVMRSGDTTDGETTFKIVNSIQGAGAIAKDSFAYLSTEPLFLTNQGIFAVTSQDITGEKYVQNRSYFLNGRMLKENDLSKAYACVYNDMYWLCINDVCYILDGLQATMTDKSMPYATRQYCGFLRTNVPANIMWVKDNRLWFGTKDGKVCRFFNDSTRLLSYNDDGDPIEAIWETPDLDGQLFFKNKTLRYLAVRVESAIATSMTIYAMNRGLWELVKEDNSFSRYFSYSNFTYSKMSYSCDATQKISRTKMRIKKVDKFRLKFVNDKLNEPLGLYDIGMEMVENGNFKG